MWTNYVFTIALLKMVSAFALPIEETMSLASPLFKRDTYNCGGSWSCSNSADYVATCNDALSKIPWTDEVLYGAAGYATFLFL